MSESIRPSSLIQEYLQNAEEAARRRNTTIRYRAPLCSKRWIPYACVVGLLSIWVPDELKVFGLKYAIERYERLKFVIHREYWRKTMSHSDFEKLMQQIEAAVPKKDRVDSPDCPL
ncbi:hypothetical protein XU18_0948 [Perkinsela sp. CCAP 1560/4]|nr:hypothetical protein XU18_0948 [Perkinsela sp. CCAP 1560/4]|eukprot:KNH08545.1 hypothetical protein XU18_0948 [Perkinsela sp. CCAP 1560/4]